MHMHTEVSTDILLIFYLDGCILLLWSSLLILDMNPYQINDLQVISPNQQFSFIFC